MKRMILIALGFAAVLALAACGGGGTTAAPDINADAGDNPLLVTAQGPTGGAHTASFVPGKLDVHFGGDPADLAASLERYGYNLEFTQGGYAGVEIGAADPQAAITQLTKEFNIFSAEQVPQVTMPAAYGPRDGNLRVSSHTPLDPYYADRFIGFPGDGDGGWTTFFGQAWPMNTMGFNGAWDISDPLNIDGQVAAEPVRVGIIDAGWLDYSTVDRGGFDETILDAAASGSVDGSGTFTPGLAAAEWENFTFAADPDGTPGSGDEYWIDQPYRATGEALLGILAASQNNYNPRAIDMDDTAGIDSDEIWNEGMAGINPNATYVLIKTGTKTVGEDSWSFTGQEIAAAIEHAWNAAACDIILVGPFAVGAVPATVQTAVTNARDNGALVIAPAGDVVSSWNGAAPDWFDDTPVDISVDPVWPAAATGCLSVTGTGFNRIGSLPPLDFGEGDVDNVGTGWTPAYNEPFNQMFTTVATYCNTGADIAAMGWGFGFGAHPYLITGGTGAEGDPYQPSWDEAFSTGSIARFSTTYAAAYVAGAASIVFQALSFVDGTPPTDEEVETILLDTVNFPGMAGILNSGGYLNANAAAMDAIAGGTLFSYEPGMAFTTSAAFSEWFSQPRAAVTRGTDLSVSPTIVNGTAPFELTIDWGDGNGEQTPIASWNSGDAATLTGGYDALGSKFVDITVTDANNQTITLPLEVYVINPLTANITIQNAAGDNPPASSLAALTQYQFKANAGNVFTGDIGGTPNATTFNWWFNSDPASDPADATGPSPVFAFPSAGNFTVTLQVVEDARPDSTFTLPVTVVP